MGVGIFILKGRVNMRMHFFSITITPITFLLMQTVKEYSKLFLLCSLLQFKQFKVSIQFG